MAASPIAALPVMSTLATVNLYRHFGTYQGADGAACAFAVSVERSRGIACGIHLSGLRDDMLGAEADANLAALAKLLVYLYASFCAHLKNSLII
jgi:hypothetical protein